MRKYAVLTAALVMHLCLGGIYAWSVFVPVLRRDFGYTAAATQAVFGLTIAVLCLGGFLGGRMQDLMGPRIPACLSAVLLGAGYLVAGSLGDRLWGLVLGIGVLCGLAVSFGYVTSMASAAKWFPERRGLAAGVVLSGYGAAAIVLSAIATALMQRGWPVLRVFRLVGLVYGPVMLAAALILRAPPQAAGGAAAARDFRRAPLLRQRRFWRLALGIWCATYPGLALIGALKPIGTWFGYDLPTATASVSALAVGNGAGRLAWGFIHDLRPARDTILLLMGAILASVIGFAAGGAGAVAFLAGAFFLGFCYGGSLAVFPAEVASAYGTHVLGSVYPVVLVFHALAALVGPPLTGLGADLTGGYWPGILAALAMAVLGPIVHLALSERE